MTLLLLRHGIAEEQGNGTDRDSERPLTPEGHRKVRLVARALGRLELLPTTILASPLLRARQTAMIVAEMLDRRRAVQDCELLAPGRSPAALLNFLRKNPARGGTVLLVGHQPDLALLAALLLTGNPHGAQLELKKAGLCVLDWDRTGTGGNAVLQLLAPARLLMRVE